MSKLRTFQNWISFCALVVALAAAAPSHAATITTFTGGDGPDGLDLDGKFIYAVHADTVGSHQVRDALFVNRNTAGFSVTSNSQVAFGAPTYGGGTPSTNDLNLRQTMDFVKFDSGAPGVVPITLANVIPGTPYKLQMLYNEACCNRVMNVSVDGVPIANNFIPGNLQTPGVRNQGTGVVITHEFVPTSSTVNILMTGVVGPGNDSNPIFDALTLEQLPTNVSIGTFTGGDVGEGLDLIGKFTYAVHAATAGSHQVGEALFLPRNQPGVTIGGNSETGFGAPTYGGDTPSTNDSNLRQVMDHVKFDSTNLADPLASGTLPIDLQNLRVGGIYKLQLLFNEACCNRVMDVLVEGIQIADELNPGVLQGGSQGVGAVLTYTFVATDTTLNILLRGDTDLGGGTDRNPIIDALTLEEVVPEPASALLGVMGLAGLALRRRRIA